MKVIVVGNAQINLDKKNGSLIDSFDIVIRCNEFVLNGYKEYVGNKVDIISTASNDLLYNIVTKQGKTKNENYISQVDTVWFPRLPMHSEKTYTIKYMKSISNILNFTYIKPHLFHSLHQKYNYRTHLISTGLLTIFMAKDHFPNAEISITGFDGFKTKHYYDEDIAPKHNFIQEQNILKDLTNNLSINLI